MIRLWDPETGTEIRRVGPGRIFAFSPNGKLLVSTVTGTFIRIWETETGREINASHGHTEAPQSLSFSADGRTLISCGADQRVVEWDLATTRQLARLFSGQVGLPTEMNKSAINALSHDGTVLAQKGPSVDGKSLTGIGLWDTVSGSELRKFGQVSYLQSLRFSPDGKLLASGSNGGIIHFDEKGRFQFVEGPPGTGGIHIWDPATGKQVRHFQPGNLRVSSIEFSPNGKLLASVDSDSDPFDAAGMIRIWDASTGVELQRWEAKGRLGFLTFAPNGKSIAFMVSDIVHIRATDSGKELLQLRRPANRRHIASLAYSPSGRILAVAESHASVFVSATALPDNEFPASCTIYLWDVFTGQELREIHVPPQSNVIVMAFSPDGRTLASGGADSAILLWDVTAPLKDGKANSPRLSADDLNALWSDLASDGAKADHAIWTLARSPQQSSPFLQDRLRLAPVTAEQLAKLIADLDSNQFALRQQAAKTLEALGDTARPALRKALDTPPPLEVRRRIELILAEGDKQAVRTLRAVEALEHMGTSEARQVLQGMTQRDARVSEAAAAALKRLVGNGS
jgi:WD40 repeat protein